MKLSSSLLQAIALGVSVSTLVATAASCEKLDTKAAKEHAGSDRSGDAGNQDNPDECPACGMG